MKNDLLTNFTQVDSITAHTGTFAAAAVNGATIDCVAKEGLTHFITIRSVAAGATLDVKEQYSADGSAWTDEATYILAQITAAGQYRLDVPHLSGRYQRLVMTGAVDTMVGDIITITGPGTHN